MRSSLPEGFAKIILIQSQEGFGVFDPRARILHLLSLGAGSLRRDGRCSYGRIRG